MEAWDIPHLRMRQSCELVPVDATRRRTDPARSLQVSESGQGQQALGQPHHLSARHCAQLTSCLAVVFLNDILIC